MPLSLVSSGHTDRFVTSQFCARKRNIAFVKIHSLCCPEPSLGFSENELKSSPCLHVMSPFESLMRDHSPGTTGHQITIPVSSSFQVLSAVLLQTFLLRVQDACAAWLARAQADLRFPLVLESDTHCLHHFRCSKLCYSCLQVYHHFILHV